MLCMNDCQLDCAVEDKLYRELSQLTKDKTIWREKIPYIGSLITDHSPKIIMGDKKQFQNTVLIYEGLWERLTLICMYIPFIHKAVYNLLS